VKGQLELTRPTKTVSVARLTERQRVAWWWARVLGHVFTVADFQEALGYQNPHGALRRLQDRGLVTRIAKGYYKGVTPGEKKR
jgi:hypothetical protein